MAIIKSDLLDIYQEIINKEQGINPNWSNIHLPNAEDMYNLTCRITFVAEQALVPRSSIRYLKAKDAEHAKIMFESVSAHTNLVTTMVRYALNYIYGINFGITKDGYSLDEIIEAIARHDLPEVIFGDIPDDKNRDEAAKLKNEETFQQHYTSLGLPNQHNWEIKVNHLLQELVYHNSPTGRLIYAADKVSAVLMALCADKKKLSLRLNSRNFNIAPMDRLATKVIDDGRSKLYYISELWTVSHFKTRRFIDYDESGFMTCLLIMYTLIVHNRWYAWRVTDY